ncbi:hypothetical protein P0082_00730 [Candidatus Haliotispira prima]|uniref:DUF445 domain-containing protein n=1 Tax=Candidatus Haliotispira prima TaxID=3034016 RepID=A0ABY8MIL0_9SPIO|nr:hypothetical protein P0082_00730 [Candidatus Haliotispira prima]
MKKKTSYIINLLLLFCVAVSLAFDSDGLLHRVLLSVGLFGLSGSLTNSLAIHMLFEKIPLVYGSGIIALNFREIKQDLEELMIRQFFNSDQIERFLAGELQSSKPDLSSLTEPGGLIDFDRLFDKFKESLGRSFENNPLARMALPLLETSRDKIIVAMRGAVAEELSGPDLEDKIKGLLGRQLPPHEQFEQRVRLLIRGRLNEMTPKTVKDIIRHMMESKLIWLVVWGALLGALMGLVSALLRYGLSW